MGFASFQPLEPRRLLSSTLPRYDHIVVVAEENHNFRDIFPLGGGVVFFPPLMFLTVRPSANLDASYFRKLARFGVSFTNAHAEQHPSQPNYMVLFSGSNQGVHKDTVPAQPITAPSLGGQLIAAGLTFTGFAEGLPSVGFTGIKAGRYARKHAPWISFTDVPSSDSRPFTDFPFSDFNRLPSLSFVIPNQKHDMHSGTIGQANQWLRHNLGGYAKWAVHHNSLLIVTWDEGSGGNHIPTIFFGDRLRHHRQTAQRIDHFRLLRTIEALFRLPPLAGDATVAPVRNVFVPRHVRAIPAGATDFVALAPGASLFSNQPIKKDLWSGMDNGPAA